MKEPPIAHVVLAPGQKIRCACGKDAHRFRRPTCGCMIAWCGNCEPRGDIAMIQAMAAHVRLKHGGP